MLQIEVQATTRSSLPKEGSQETDSSENGSQGDAKALGDGNEAGSTEYHDVSPSSPSGNGNQDTNKGSSSPSVKAETSGRQSDSSQASTSEERSKSGVARSTDSKSSGSKQSSGSPSGTIGGHGTQEEYQEARLRFLSSGQGVLVSADTISMDEGQVGSLVTASFDDL